MVYRVVVAALEIIPACFGIIVVAAIAGIRVVLLRNKAACKDMRASRFAALR